MNKKVIYCTLASSLLLASSTIAGEVSSNIILPSPGAASIGGFETSLTAGYHSKYIWRGIDLGSDMVDASIETTGSVAGLDLTAGVWHAHIFSPNGSDKETDYYVDISKDLGFATASVGYIYYDLTGAHDAQEVYFGLSKDIAGISTSLTYYWDIEVDNEGYLELGLSKTLTPYELDASVTVGYFAERGAIAHVTSSLSKSFDLGYGITASPYISYSVELDDLEGYAGAPQQNEFFGGVSFSYSF